MGQLVSGENDLAGGIIGPLQERIIGGQLEEEAQRRRWKTAVLWGSAIGILVFYLTFLGFILCVRACWVNPASSNLVIGLLAGIPTLLAINLFKLVGRSGHAKDSDDFERSPWLALAKELIDAIKPKPAG
jgi:hypothetical protein